MNQNIITRVSTSIVMAVVTLFCSTLAFAHPATERYIPIGYWSSVGGNNTYVGSLTGVSIQANTLSFNDGGQDREVRITEDTDIWIDRSHLKLKSIKGKRSDIKAGVKTEIKLKEGSDGVAEWVKVKGSR